MIYLDHAATTMKKPDEVVEADHRLHALRERIARKIKDNVGVTLKVTLLPPGQAPRSEGGKLRRVLDLRK